MLKLYNTLTRKKETFKPLEKGKVGIYSCGPTVYNYAHIGNLKTYIFNDLLFRSLKFLGYKVTHVMNTTDVDDKTIMASQKNNQQLKEFTRQYEKIFFDDTRQDWLYGHSGSFSEIREHQCNTGVVCPLGIQEPEGLGGVSSL